VESVELLYCAFASALDNVVLNTRCQYRAAGDGRITPGKKFHRAHGDNELAIFTILDMRPYEYITVIVDFIEGSVVKYTTYLIPSGSGTKVLPCSDAIVDSRTAVG
jgi:hypothetical protein